MHPLDAEPLRGYLATSSPVLLIVDDDPENIELVQDLLTGSAFIIHGAHSVKAAQLVMSEVRVNLVLLDVVLPDGHGLELLRLILEADPQTDVILMTGHYSTEAAVEAIQKGAHDYLTKPLNIPAFCQRIERWLTDYGRLARLAAIEDELVQVCAVDGIVGRSPAILDVFSKIRRIAPHFETALVWGETGTGKEMGARALHALSGRSGPFVVCNCAAISESLFESELFGHEKGAFTGAFQSRVGFVEAARGGTLFLDEVAEIPLGAQAKLLRVIQNREIQRVGSTRVQSVDVRIVAATNRDLKVMVAQRLFREDLYYRLAAIQLSLPPLSARGEDIPLLQQHFLKRYCDQYKRPRLRLSRKATAMLNSYCWPGNVRELENVMSYACMMAESDVIEFTDFPESFQQAVALPEREDWMTVDQLVARHFRQTLHRCGGNFSKAAKMIGISRATLYRFSSKDKQS